MKLLQWSIILTCQAISVWRWSVSSRDRQTHRLTPFIHTYTNFFSFLSSRLRCNENKTKESLFFFVSPRTSDTSNLTKSRKLFRYSRFVLSSIHHTRTASTRAWNKVREREGGKRKRCTNDEEQLQHQQLCFEYQWSVICRLKMNLCLFRFLCSLMLQKPWIKTLNTVVDHPVVFFFLIRLRFNRRTISSLRKKKEKNLNKVFFLFIVWLFLVFFSRRQNLSSFFHLHKHRLIFSFFNFYFWGKHLEFSSFTLIFFFLLLLQPWSNLLDWIDWCHSKLHVRWNWSHHFGYVHWVLDDVSIQKACTSYSFTYAIYSSSLNREELVQSDRLQFNLSFFLFVDAIN